MQSNWSLILNVFLLFGVVLAILRIIKFKRQSEQVLPKTPSLGQVDMNHYDDIIAVRKVAEEVIEQKPMLKPIDKYNIDIRPIAKVAVASEIRHQASDANLSSQASHEDLTPDLTTTVEFRKRSIEETTPAREILIDESEDSLDAEQVLATEKHATETQNVQTSPLMMFLLAKENRQLAGYELLQALLAAGLRFGEGNLFHRHQSPNGQGTIMCSLAAATPSGVFDLQNMGAFVVRGLCLFMQASGNPTIDEERFEMMLDTARKLSDGLDTYLLDDKRQPLSDESVRRYQNILKLHELCEQSA